MNLICGKRISERIETIRKRVANNDYVNSMSKEDAEKHGNLDIHFLVGLLGCIDVLSPDDLTIIRTIHSYGTYDSHYKCSAFQVHIAKALELISKVESMIRDEKNEEPLGKESHTLTYYTSPGHGYAIYYDGEMALDSNRYYSPRSWQEVLLSKIAEKVGANYEEKTVAKKMLPDKRFPDSMVALEDHVNSFNKIKIQNKIVELQKQIDDLRKETEGVVGTQRYCKGL